MPSYLRVRFENDGDGTGRLVARAEADGFSGEGAAYFNIQKIEDFASALGVFPLPAEDEHRAISGGFWSQEQRGKLDQEHLGISVYLADARHGYIGIQVRMATELRKGSRPQSKKQAIIEVVTTYEPLSKFSRDLVAVLRSSIKEALLQGQNIS